MGADGWIMDGQLAGRLKNITPPLPIVGRGIKTKKKVK